jgi:hypothetical protein
VSRSAAVLRDIIGLNSITWQRLALVVGAIVAPWGWFSIFGSTGRDDSYITFAFARILAETGQLVNLNGDPIEGSTTLGFVPTAWCVGSLPARLNTDFRLGYRLHFSFNFWSHRRLDYR